MKASAGWNQVKWIYSFSVDSGDQEKLSMFFMNHNPSVSTDFLSGLKTQQNFLKTAFQRKQRLHNYSVFKSGQDYAFELIEGGTKGYMTGQGRSVKVNDYILLREESGLSQYKVEQIDYYSSPSDMWIALLEKIRR